MTPYTYEFPDGSRMTLEFPFGQAPQTVGRARRTYDTVAMQFTYGKEAFHGPTIGEQTAREMARAVEDGRPAPEPVGYTHF